MSDHGLAAPEGALLPGQELPGHDNAAKGVSRPKDAATLLILDKTIQGWRVLMGKRHAAHVFMPGKMVFPGGKVERGDTFVPVASELREEVAAKLAAHLQVRIPDSRVRALGVAALRETAEETGILIGAAYQPSHRSMPKAFRVQRQAPNLAPLALVARAITPPRRVRRFDARFFAVLAREISFTSPQPKADGELEDLVWPLLSETQAMDLPNVTRRVISALAIRLGSDPELSPGRPVPFYRDGASGHRVDFI